MVSLDDIREHVASLFIMLNKKTFILFRIEFLVVLAALVFFTMFLMDYYRRIIHDSFMRAAFSVFDAVSDSIVVYLLGAMQTAPFKNQLFPVWALVLVNFRYSADFISGYGVPDRRGRRFIEWRNVFKLLGAAFLNSARGSSFFGPLWLVWVLQIARSAYRLISHQVASRAIWHGRSSELVAEYMCSMHEHDDQVGSGNNNSNGREAFNPVTMEGCRYLVYGETKHKERDFRLKKPQYALSLPTSRRKCTWQATKCWFQQTKETPKLITLDKIWKCCPIDQQPPQEQQGNEAVKDLPLAFALSRLLRCRFEDVTLQRSIFDRNRDLMKSILANKAGASGALRIMELQLAFVHDYFNTRYPMVFCCGLPSLFISLFLSVMTMVAVVWLGVEIRKVFRPPSGELANLVKGFNIDTIITWLFIVLLIAKEIWEILTYLRSDWTRLIEVCEHVQRKCESNKEFKDISRPKITGRRWHGLIDQYVFVESYNGRPWFWNLMHNLTTGIVPKKDDGAKLGSAIPVPDCVTKAVTEKLSELTKDNAKLGSAVPVPDCVTKDNGDGRAGLRDLLTLPENINTLSNNNLSMELQRYKAYTAGANGVVLPTASHIILVWHIATSLCEMELAKKHGVDLGSPGFPCSLLSWLSSLCSSKPYLMDVDDKKGCCCGSSSSLSWFMNCCCSSSSKSSDGKLPETGDLRKSYIIANSLSRYCAYLLVSKPDLIPDSFLVPKLVFQKAVRSAREGIFKGTGSLQERHEALMDEADEGQGTQAGQRDEEDVLKQGIALGKLLLRHPFPTEEDRWKILADVWTELLIHIAPTKNARAHKKCLAAGEFITHVWALLWHYGIEKSSLWPKDTGPENNQTQAQAQPQAQVGDGSDRPAAGMIERRPTGGDTVTEVAHVGITIDDEADDNKEKEEGTKELDAGDSSTTSTGLLRMEGTAGSSEIVEVSEDETTNVQRGMAGQSPKRAAVN